MQKIIKNFRTDDRLLASFNQLAEETFGFNFSPWMNAGYWDQTYIPYAVVEEGEVLANASVSLGILKTKDASYQVAQIGTVMTKTSARSQGLARKLMEKIIADYEDTTDFIYLFANESVLDFYPKFGFTRQTETLDRYQVESGQSSTSHLKKVTFEEVQAQLQVFVKARNTDHLEMTIENHQALSMFYYQLVFSEMIYYAPDLSCFVCFEREDSQLYLYDVLAQTPIQLKAIIAALPLEGIEEIIFHFPVKDREGLKISRINFSDDDDALFIKSKAQIPQDITKFPLFNHS